MKASGLGLIVLAALVVASPRAAAAALQCRPLVQLACDDGGCTRRAEGFQHAESFFFNTKNGRLGACLWTNCYSANAQVLRATPDAAAFTAIALLQPENTLGGHEPRVVSLTVDADGRFVAVWQYRGDGLVFDQGRCETTTR
jgi:hypothetical protein